MKQTKEQPKGPGPAGGTRPFRPGAAQCRRHRQAGPSDRWLGHALRTVVAAAVLGAGLCARAEPGEARAEAPAAIVDLQRQVNELRSDLLDEREQRIDRRQEANGLVLVFLGIAIGIGGLWIYAKLRFIADATRIGAVAARRYAPEAGGLLPGAALPREPRGDSSGALLFLAAAGPESSLAIPARAAANGSARPAAMSRAAAATLPFGGFADRAGPTGPGLDPGQLHRHEEAIADCSEAIRLHPRDPALYLERAEARSTVARFEEAIADYDKAILLNPDHAGAYLGRCHAKSELGRHEEAVEDYDHAVRLDPDSVAA